ncbi:ABC transporter permease [Chryseolinea sp. T2]|uniref:ABC transporter permease n=1 Tax=Chryseolinea sp. T2 TaxID=3129255 RepID=UPI003078824A
MISNYLQIAFRNMFRNLRFTVLHLTGLSLGLAAVMLIAWYVYDEMSYDELANRDRVFRINTYWGDNPESEIFASTPPPLAQAIKEEVPEIEKIARAFTWNHSTMRLPADENHSPDEVVFRETRIFIVDPEFLEVLQYPMLLGDPQKAFHRPESIVLTRKTAERYFGEAAIKDGSLIGKSILFGGDRTARVVTAVVDPPQNTHLHFDMLVNINFGYEELDTINVWTWNIMHTYVKVKEGISNTNDGLKQLQSKLTHIAERHIRATEELEGSQTADFRLQPIKDIHLHSHFQREHESNGDYTTVQLLVSIAALIVLLACANFVNLFTAQSVRRSKEIGVRKTLGSARKTLAAQFFMESAIYALIAAVLALSLVEILRRPFNELVGKQIDFAWLNHLPLLAGFAILLLIVIILAGSYPSLYLSSFNPSKALKGKLTQGGNFMRNGLVIFQFSISIGLMICSVFIMRQLNYMQDRKPGYDRENVVVVKNDKEIQDKWQMFRDQLESREGIAAVSFNSGVPAQPLVAMRDFRKKGNSIGTGIHFFLADDRYLPALALTLLDGSNFSSEPKQNKGKILINETAAKVLGLDQAVGAAVTLNAGENDEEQLEVIGLVKDFNVESLHNGVKPLILYYYIPDAMMDYIAVRLRPGNVSKGLNTIEETWKTFEPENPFNYSFLDQDFELQYISEQRLSKLFGAFTGLTVAIALLGLTGLASFLAEQRTKEISIRKVLGASVTGIMVLFSKDFTRLALVAMLIAVPAAYFVMQSWLNEFAYRIELGAGVFVSCSIITLALIWTTVSLLSLRIARLNPANTLKNE